MFNKINIKWLAGIFLLLLLLVLLAMPRREKSTSRSFKSELTDFDSAKITAINIYPKNGGEMITLERNAGNWSVKDATGTYNAANAQADEMIKTLFDLTAKRLASKSKDKQGYYQVDDSTGIRVQAIAGSKTVADVYVGKFNYQQPPQGANPYMRQQQGTMTTFIRMTKSNDIYAVDGFLSMTFGRTVADLRDRKVLGVNKDKVSKVSFNSPAGDFNLIKQDSIWMIDGLVTDSASAAEYISGLSFVSNSAFLTENAVMDKTPQYVLTIEAEDLTEPVKVNAYVSDTTNRFAITSSTNKGTYFSGNTGGLFDQLFPTKNSFFEKEEELTEKE